MTIDEPARASAARRPTESLRLPCRDARPMPYARTRR
jgi:hypothetical protein